MARLTLGQLSSLQSPLSTRLCQPNTPTLPPYPSAEAEEGGGKKVRSRQSVCVLGEVGRGSREPTLEIQVALQCRLLLLVLALPAHVIP